MIKNLFFFLTFFMLSAFAKNQDTPSELRQKEIESIRKYIEGKRHVTIKEKGGTLSLSGEVHVELQSTSEEKNGVKQRGRGGATSFPSRAWDVEADILLDYRAERAWAVVKLKLDNDAGIQGGSANKISLDLAFLGGKVLSRDAWSIDLEVGRRGLGRIFDSKVMYGSRMDGILCKYDHAFDQIGDLYFHGGPFLVDEKCDRYAYVGEIGALNIWKTGLYSKISAIHWDTKHVKNDIENSAYRYLPIQWTLGYKLKALDRVFTFYGAALYNPLARQTVVSYGKRKGWGAYAGLSVGDLKKQGNWSFDANYQWVQLQAVPDFDGSGIKRGNAAGYGLYSKKNGGCGDPLHKGEGVGAGNFKGFAVEFLYLLTNNITLYQGWRQSVNQDPKIGPRFSYKQYEFEIIYGF